MGKTKIGQGRDTLCVHLPKGYREHLGKIAYGNDRSMSAEIRRAIERLVLENLGLDLRKTRSKKS